MQAIQPPKFEELNLEGGLAEFIKLIGDKFPCAHNSYRGTSKTTHDLVPTLGRLREYRNADDPQKKIELETYFLSRSFQARTPWGPAHYNEIAAAIAAQHHGAPTRLLDWTDSPLIALFFATEPKTDKKGIITPTSDAAVWVKHECPVEYHSDGKPLNRSFQIDVSVPQKFREIEWVSGSSGFQPIVLTPRISAQLGSFTICEKPDVDLLRQCSGSITHIWKVIIQKKEIPKIQADLYRLGVRKRSIYPDEDGLNTSLVAEMLLDNKLEGRCGTDDSATSPP